MNRKNKAYLKINIISLFFIAISSISVTLAWFAYTGIAKVSTEIDIQAWLIEFEKNDTTVSNDIVISLDDIYPGMGTVHEKIKIKNKGDSNAKLSYIIQSVRILDEELKIDDYEQDYLKDKLSHEYPFNINIDLSDNFVLAKGKEAEIEMSVSWPLDSVNVKKGDDEIDSNKIDSEWGSLAYQFEQEEQKKYQDDPSYQIRPSIKIVVSAKAEQIIDTENSSDIRYPLGKLILYDVKNNKRCVQLNEESNDNCIRTHVIDINNKVSDTNVSLLPDLLETYSSGIYDDYTEILKTTTDGWNIDYRKLEIDDILKIISKDIKNSMIIRDGVSNQIIGYLNHENRINNIISTMVPYNGYFSFLNDEYNYLVTNKCYWLNKEYDSNRAFALTKIDEDSSKIYGKEKNKIDELGNEKCSVIPVIIAPKDNLNIQ